MGGSFNVLGIGLIAVVVGTAVLVGMVRYDLGPSGRLARGGQWLLATALGTGVLAFAFKLVLIIAVANAPEVMIAPIIAKDPVPVPPAVEDPLYGALDSARFAWVAMPVQGPDDAAAKPYVWHPLPETAPAPADNPTTPAKVALGERLYFDRNLSRDGTLSCASCHPVRAASGADGRATSLGIERQTGTRNAPTVWNAAFQAVQFWDGRAPSLEAQAKGPLVNPVEMGMPSLAAVEQRVRDDPQYREPFAKAFGNDEPITIDHIAAAIAAYERTLITPDTPYDRFVRGDLKALSPAQLRGMGLFQSVGCVSCHGGPNFSVASVFDAAGKLAVSQPPVFQPRTGATAAEAASVRSAALRLFPAFPNPDQVSYQFTRDPGAAPTGSARGYWRVPSLRNVALTGPYFHNGAVKDLAEAVRIMARAELGRTGPYLVWSDRNKTLIRLGDRPALGAQEVSDIVAFLQALSSDRLVAGIKRASARPRSEVTYATN